MDYEEFASSVKELAADCQPEAIPMWRDFAVENVQDGQFVRFEPETDQVVAVGKWLDAFYAAFCAIKDSFGQETTEAVINLSAQKCCLYPGEMTQAAICLESQKGPEQIFSLIESGDIDPVDLFVAMPRQEAEKCMRDAGVKRPASVLEHLNGKQVPAAHNMTTPKKSTEREL